MSSFPLVPNEECHLQILQSMQGHAESRCQTGCFVQDGSVYGVALNAGVRSKAALLPQSTRTHLRNAHLEPSPRGALADLKPVQNAKDEPGFNEIKVWQYALPRYISRTENLPDGTRVQACCTLRLGVVKNYQSVSKACAKVLQRHPVGCTWSGPQYSQGSAFAANDLVAKLAGIVVNGHLLRKFFPLSDPAVDEH